MEIADSARKRGHADEDILHAYRNPIRIYDTDDMQMIIGPDRAGNLLEVGVSTRGAVRVIVHAMSAPAEMAEVMTTMPKTMQEILDHADELAARFEEWEPGPGATVTVTPLGRLYDAVQARARSERAVAAAVAEARADGVSWRVIGLTLGTSPQAARQRYGER